MEFRFEVSIQKVYENKSIQVFVVRKIISDGAVLAESNPCARVLEKNSQLETLDCIFDGDAQPTTLLWSDFLAERDYILAKWAE